MTTHTTRRLIATLVLPLLLLAVGCDSGNALMDPDSQATPDAFTIQSVMVTESSNTVEGTFEASGFVDDQGAYREVLNSLEPLHRLPSLYGTKTLQGEKGTITIEFYVGLSPTNQNTIKASGGFHIVSGSGAYVDLQGGGQIDRVLGENASPTALTSVLEGIAQYGQ
jgi:hypothetical protein